MFTVSGVVAAFQRHNAKRSAIRALAGLSALQLRDIGIPSDAIGDVVDGLIEFQNSRRAHAVRAAALPSAASIRIPVAAAGSLQGCG